jgi:hypothetical protein
MKILSHFALWEFVENSLRKILSLSNKSSDKSDIMFVVLFSAETSFPSRLKVEKLYLSNRLCTILMKLFKQKEIKFIDFSTRRRIKNGINYRKINKTLNFIDFIRP